MRKRATGEGLVTTPSRSARLSPLRPLAAESMGCEPVRDDVCRGWHFYPPPTGQKQHARAGAKFNGICVSAVARRIDDTGARESVGAQAAGVAVAAGCVAGGESVSAGLN